LLHNFGLNIFCKCISWCFQNVLTKTIVIIVIQVFIFSSNQIKTFFITLGNNIPDATIFRAREWNVVAQSDEECFDLITAEDENLNDDYYNRLRENILKAPTYALAEDVESEIVEQFTT
jgi:hypothetical protein